MLGCCAPGQQPRSGTAVLAESARAPMAARVATTAPVAPRATPPPRAPLPAASSSGHTADQPPRASAFGGGDVVVYDTAFGGGPPLVRGARVGFMRIQCSAEAHRCFNAGYRVNARALFACFHVEYRSARPALLRALGQAIDADGEIADRALLGRLAPAAPLPTYAVVHVTRWDEVPIYEKQGQCRGPCAHQMPRQIGMRREHLTSEMELQPGGGSPGISDPTIHAPLAIARRVPLTVHFFVPAGPDTAPDRLRELVRSGQGVPSDVDGISPLVEAEDDPSLRFSGFVMLASAALSRRAAGAPTARWLGEIRRLAPIVKSRLDARDQAAVDQTLHSLATLESGKFLTKVTACPPASDGSASTP